MADDPLETVYSFVERSYVRMQVGDVLIRCFEEGTSVPIHQMVEGLIVAGPQSLGALREILAEVGQRRSQVQDDLHQVYAGFESSLKSYGVRLIGYRSPRSILRLSPSRFLAMLRDQEVVENETQIACLQILRDSRGLIKNLTVHLRLLEEIESYLSDWLWGLASQSARQGVKNDYTPRPGEPVI